MKNVIIISLLLNLYGCTIPFTSIYDPYCFELKEQSFEIDYDDIANSATPLDVGDINAGVNSNGSKNSIANIR